MLSALAFWLLCFWLNRDGSIIPKIGGGCFSSKKQQPVYNPPAPPPLPPAPVLPPAPILPKPEELFAAGGKYAQENFPMAYGAQESAVRDLGLGSSYYQQFQPTSFEDALSNQYFKNVMPTAENKILNYLSLAGIANSPITARLIGDQWGKSGFEVGSYLSNLGNERAQYSLNQRLGINPMNFVSPFVETGSNQALNQGRFDTERSFNQANFDSQYGMNKYNADYQYAQQLAEAGYMKDMQDYQQKQAAQKRNMMLAGLGVGALGGAMFMPALMGGPATMSSIGGIGGAMGTGLTAAGLPAMSAGTGALMGASLGGGIGGMMGGDQNSFGSGMSMARSFTPQAQNVWGNTNSGISMETMLALMKAGVLK